MFGTFLRGFDTFRSGRTWRCPGQTSIESNEVRDIPKIKPVSDLRNGEIGIGQEPARFEQGSIPDPNTRRFSSLGKDGVNKGARIDREGGDKMIGAIKFTLFFFEQRQKPIC